MLSESPPTRFTATCDKCRAALPFTAASADAARVDLVALGWIEAAVKGRGRDRWLWWCPNCKPKAPTSWGRST